MNEASERTQFDYLLNAMERAGQAHNPHMEGYGDKRRALFAYVRDLEARAAAPAVQAPEVALWQVRWTNPGNDPHRTSECQWEEVNPRHGQTLEQRLDELRSYRSDGKPCYEVRPLYAAAPAQAVTNGVPASCEWSETDPWGDMPGTYESACGEMWSFNEGGVKENGVKFCQNCGKPVVVVPFPQPADEDAAAGVVPSQAQSREVVPCSRCTSDIYCEMNGCRQRPSGVAFPRKPDQKGGA
jgi:hypothetical protein